MINISIYCLETNAAKGMWRDCLKSSLSCQRGDQSESGSECTRVKECEERKTGLQFIQDPDGLQVETVLYPAGSGLPAVVPSAWWQRLVSSLCAGWLRSQEGIRTKTLAALIIFSLFIITLKFLICANIISKIKFLGSITVHIIWNYYPLSTS